LEQCTAKLHALRFFSTLNPIQRIIANVIFKLNQRQDMVIKPADKNLGTCIIGIQDYRQLCMAHLSNRLTYQVVTEEFFSSIAFQRLRIILHSHGVLHDPYKRNFGSSADNKLSKLAASLLQLQGSSQLRKTARFYILPKMHKKTVSGRPIVSCLFSLSYHTSKFLNNILQDLYRKLPHVAISSRDVLADLHGKQFSRGSVIVCADVASLYPSIPTEYGLRVFKEVLHMYRFDLYPIPLVVDLMRWVLTHNYIDFEQVIYLQLEGTAMGTPAAVVYASIVMFYHEQASLAAYPPSFYRRYIDDLFLIFPDVASGRSFTQHFNSILPAIQLDDITSGSSGVFLDMLISINVNGFVQFRLYQKVLNKYLYIPPYTSHHPSIFKNLVQQELRRYCLFSSHVLDYIQLKQMFYIRLLQRGYQESMLLPLFRSATFSHAELVQELLANKLTKRTAVTARPVMVLSLPQCQLTLPMLGSLFRLSHDLISHPTFSRAFSTPTILISRKYNKSIGRILSQDDFSGGHNPRKRRLPVAEYTSALLGTTAEENHLDPHPNHKRQRPNTLTE
jgi:hypothetical protein